MAHIPPNNLPPGDTSCEDSECGKAAGCDWRYLDNGQRIPLPAGYLDQPYFLRADDGALVLVCTNCVSSEGQAGQHVVCIRSEDNGQSWSAPIALEPPDGVEASYAVIIKAEYGRIYAFYNHNTDNIRKVACDLDASPDGWCRRVDSLGHFVFKYSDDHGKSWSQERYNVPVREFEIDRENTSGGAIRYFWNVGKAFWHQQCAYVPIHKVGGFGVNFFTRTEGALIKIDNLNDEQDPLKLNFATLPDGEAGIRPPKAAGPIGEEHSFVALSDNSLFTVFRTIAGHPACAYSRDHGHSWSEADFLRYPDGRAVKNPRAANFIWKLSQGRYLYWFHNHSGKSYADRNPVWCLAAREVATADGLKLEFSQPEVLLYTDDITCRMSYPDCMELEDGSLLLTETEKRIARMHRIPAAFINKVCGQWECLALPCESDLIAEIQNSDKKCLTANVELPVMYDREGGWEVISGEDLRSGFSLIFELAPDSKPGILLDNRTTSGRGLCVQLDPDRCLRAILCDDRAESHWKFSKFLSEEMQHHIGIIVDGGPKIISGIFNGIFDDGAGRQFGFGLYNQFLQSANSGQELRIQSDVTVLSIYSRALLTAEVVSCQKQAALQSEDVFSLHT